jgi:hypothetical protein
MTTSDVIEVAIPVGIPYTPPAEGRGVPAGARARVPTTVSKGNALSSASQRVATAMWSDLAGAWVWRGQPPTLLDLWRRRIPSLDAVPGGNKTLWVGWIAWNHAALMPTAVIATLLWVLQHPARAGLATAVVVPIVLMWITG